MNAGAPESNRLRRTTSEFGLTIQCRDFRSRACGTTSRIGHDSESLAYGLRLSGSPCPPTPARSILLPFVKYPVIQFPASMPRPESLRTMSEAMHDGMVSNPGYRAIDHAVSTLTEEQIVQARWMYRQRDSAYAAPAPAKVLMKDGEWLVPLEERPRKYQIQAAMEKIRSKTQ